MKHEIKGFNATGPLMVNTVGGPVKVTAIFTTASEANAWLLQNLDHALLSMEGEFIFVARKDDLGKAKDAGAETRRIQLNSLIQQMQGTDMGLHTVGKQLAELTGVSRDQHVLLPSGHMLTYKQLGRRVLETLLVWA